MSVVSKSFLSDIHVKNKYFSGHNSVLLTRTVLSDYSKISQRVHAEIDSKGCILFSVFTLFEFEKCKMGNCVN